MQSAATVIVPHTESGLRDKVREAVLRQHPRALFVLTHSRDPFAYANALRYFWRRYGELVICEQDVIPPPDAIPELLECPHDWCSHAHWVGHRYSYHTTGLVKFSTRLRAIHTDLMDAVCAKPDPRYWVRMGWTSMPRDCSVADLNGPGSRATLRQGAPAVVSSVLAYERPTTHDWHGIDTSLFSLLGMLHVELHPHQPHAPHLHNYDDDPVGSHVPWHQSPPWWLPGPPPPSGMDRVRPQPSD